MPGDSQEPAAPVLTLLGQRLQRCRTEHNLSAEALAARIGTAPETYRAGESDADVDRIVQGATEAAVRIGCPLALFVPEGRLSVGTMIRRQRDAARLTVEEVAAAVPSLAKGEYARLEAGVTVAETWLPLLSRAADALKKPFALLCFNV